MKYEVRWENIDENGDFCQATGHERSTLNYE